MIQCACFLLNLGHSKKTSEGTVDITQDFMSQDSFHSKRTKIFDKRKLKCVHV